MSTETMIVYPTVTATIENVAAVAIGVRHVDVEFNAPRRTVRFARRFLKASNGTDSGTDFCRRVTELAETHGQQVDRSLTGIR